MNPEAFELAVQDRAVAEAIEKAEGQTSGEICVFVSSKELKPDENVVIRATKRFHKLGMTRTRDRNAVLLYFAPKSQRFAIIGDEGIHRLCGQAFWDELAAEMRVLLGRHEFTAAVVHAVEKAGTLLAGHFPRQSDDQNEIPDRVVRD